MKSFFIGIVIVLISGEASSSQCRQIFYGSTDADMAHALENYEGIFLARATFIPPVNNIAVKYGQVFELEVLKAYRGPSVGKKMRAVQNLFGDSYQFKSEMEYLVFASDIGEHDLTVRRCSRTTQLKYANNEIGALNERTK
ncbi:MAG: hypothetical protein AB8B96_04725 [Lysobacterales bacterium]